MYGLTYCSRSLGAASPKQCLAAAIHFKRQPISTTPPFLKQPVLGIAREDVTLWERRAPLSPNHVETLVRSGVKVLVQPSSRRAYSISEYESAGAVLTDDLSEADTIIGKNGGCVSCLSSAFSIRCEKGGYRTPHTKQDLRVLFPHYQGPERQHAPVGCHLKEG